MILYFHKLVEENDIFEGDDVSIQEFRRGINLLRTRGYEIVTLEHYLSQKRESHKVAITFDDAYQCIDKYSCVLEELDIPITIFCPVTNIFTGKTLNESKLSNKSSYVRILYKQSGVILRYLIKLTLSENFYTDCLTIAKLEKLYAKRGLRMSIGGHGFFHIKHSNINLISLPLEIMFSRFFLKNKNFFVNMYSYPYGHFTKPASFLVKLAGYKYGLATESGSNDPMCIRRVSGKKVLRELS